MLKLGIFMMPIHPANKNLVDCLEEDRNLVIKADKLNYSEAWMVTMIKNQFFLGSFIVSTQQPKEARIIYLIMN